MRLLIDTICTNPACEHIDIDVFVTDKQYPNCQLCGERTVRCWQSSGSVIGDEIDIDIKNGLCHDDGTPKHFSSREALKREAASKGWVNHVEHIGSSGSDKNKHTQRWV